jgi:hypothetical protein
MMISAGLKGDAARLKSEEKGESHAGVKGRT